MNGLTNSAFEVNLLYFIMASEQREKIAFNVRVNLVCSASWVQAPNHIDLHNQARAISIRVDPRGLASGPHFTEVSRQGHSLGRQGIWAGT